ncbi:MAG TPA: formyl transferase [Longimicrobiaceae bacterium]
MTLRVAVLCSDDSHHRYLVAALRARFDVVGVTIETGASKLQRLLRRRAWRDYAWALYHAARRRLLGLDAYRRTQFSLPPGMSASGLAERTVDWINDRGVAEMIAASRPDVTIVMGTSILKKALLDRIGPVVLNVHGGYLPDYRGNHCFFFALYGEEFDRIGSTIHFVDEGVDTGDIVAHVLPPMHPGDSAEALYCRAEKLAIECLVQLLERYESTGRLPRRPQQPGGHLFRTRDRKPRHDVGLWLRRRMGRLPIPSRSLPEIHVAETEWSSPGHLGAGEPAPTGRVDEQARALETDSAQRSLYPIFEIGRSVTGGTGTPSISGVQGCEVGEAPFVIPGN